MLVQAYLLVGTAVRSEIMVVTTGTILDQDTDSTSQKGHVLLVELFIVKCSKALRNMG